MFEWLYQMFGRVTKKGLVAFLIKRLPYYLIGLTILMIWGIKGVMFTFFVVIAFFFGWFVNKLMTAVKDYRLAQRLDRIHFTHIEYDTMKRERDLAIQAFQMITEKAARRVKAAATPPMPSAPSYGARQQFDPDTIREYVRQHGVEVEE